MTDELWRVSIEDVPGIKSTEIRVTLLDLEGLSHRSQSVLVLAEENIMESKNLGMIIKNMKRKIIEMKV